MNRQNENEPSKGHFEPSNGQNDGSFGQISVQNDGSFHMTFPVISKK